MPANGANMACLHNKGAGQGREVSALGKERGSGASTQALGQLGRHAQHDLLASHLS
jgi:hypothetical protein